MTRDPELEALSREMARAVARVASRKLVVRPEALREFCRIVQENHPVYLDLGEARRAGLEKIPVPASYLLTLITPLSHELFTTGIGPLLGPVIKGVIHTSSVIELSGPLYCDTPYRLELEFAGLVRQKGKMGEYLVGSFPHKVFDPGNEPVAVDRHVFFLRTA